MKSAYGCPLGLKYDGQQFFQCLGRIARLYFDAKFHSNRGNLLAEFRVVSNTILEDWRKRSVYHDRSHLSRRRKDITLKSRARYLTALLQRLGIVRRLARWWEFASYYKGCVLRRKCIPSIDNMKTKGYFDCALEPIIGNKNACWWSEDRSDFAIL